MFRNNQKFSAQSLKLQLFQWLLILILPLILISAITSYKLAHQYINKTFDKTLYRSALALADQVSLEELGATVNLPQAAKNLLEFDEVDDIYFRIIGPRGDLISTHIDLPLPKIYPKDDQYLYYDASLNDEKLRVVVYALPNSVTFTKNNSIYVLVGETLKKRNLMTNEIILSMLLPQLFIALLVCGVLFFGIKRGLEPLEQLKINLNDRSVNDLSLINQVNIPSELQPLLNAFNALLARLSFSNAKQQRFIGEAAHQLRTPLAGLKTQTELALRENSPLKINHALNQINQASSNLSHLVNQLLSLSKAEPDSISFMLFDKIDLVAFAKEISGDWVPKALEKNIDLGFNAELQSTFIQGNAALLRELMNNLIDNAIRYTHVGGEITVGVEKDSTTTTFYVQDNGIGVSIADQAHVFERFYRALGTNQEGSGLGLNIAKEIAERHLANISLVSAGVNQGSIFKVSFND